MREERINEESKYMVGIKKTKGRLTTKKVVKKQKPSKTTKVKKGLLKKQPAKKASNAKKTTSKKIVKKSVVSKKTAVKKTTAKKPQKPSEKKGLFSFLFGKEKQPLKASRKKTSLAPPKPGSRKAPEKPSFSDSTRSIQSLKEPKQGKKELVAPKQKTPSPVKPISAEIRKELVAEYSYDPEPFRGSPLELKKNKILTAEGLKRLFGF